MRPYLLIAALLAVACTEPDERIFPGMLIQDVGFEPLTAPDTVPVGVPFMVTIKTVGGGCVRPGPVSVEAPSALVRVLKPFDIEPLNRNCPGDVRPLPRDVALRFNQVGQGTVRVIGSRSRGLNDTVTIEKVIVVR